MCPLPTIHTLAALLELKCVDRQQWQQTRALEPYGRSLVEQSRLECELHLLRSPSTTTDYSTDNLELRCYYFST